MEELWWSATPTTTATEVSARTAAAAATQNKASKHVCSAGHEWVGGASVSPDNDVFVHLARVYSDNHASMHRGDSCWDGRLFPHGITNGYQWYPLSGRTLGGRTGGSCDQLKAEPGVT